MDPIYRTALIVPPNEIDFSNRLKVSAFFNYLQNTASLHAEQLQLGYRSLNEQGIFWVLSWVKIEVDSYPHYGDPISVATWPHSRYKIFSLRDFLFSDQQERVFARARSAWLLVDAASKRITSLERLPTPVPYYDGLEAMHTLPERKPPDDGGEQVAERQIGYSDLDLNQHANNARYVEYLLDCYSLEFHQTHQVRSLAISFNAESKFGERLSLTRSNTNGALAHEIVARKGEKIVFQACLEWRPKEEQFSPVS